MPTGDTVGGERGEKHKINEKRWGLRWHCAMTFLVTALRSPKFKQPRQPFVLLNRRDTDPMALPAASLLNE